MYLINYIKTQVDLSIVNGGDEAAVTLFERLYRCPCNDDDIRLQVLLLGMSVYEHLLAHDKIAQLFSEAETIVQSKSEKLSSSTLSIFYRNKGLCFPHSELKTEYFFSLQHAVHISNIAVRHLIFGTSMNNLGLSYFYRGEIEMASRAFSSSKEHLNRVGYNTARVSNNLGVCCYMLHDWQGAFNCFSVAASGQTEGIFMSLCIQTNLAITLYSIGKCLEAKEILDILIDEYTRGEARSQDTLIYCAAMINRGYIAFQEKDFFKAAEYYQKSQIHNYRYQNEEQLRKRKLMRDISIQLGISPNSDIDIDIDLDDTKFDIYKKPYSLIPFAFYVI